MTQPQAPAPRPGGAFVSPDAQVAGDVSLAPGVVVHGGAVIGAGCSIGSGAVVHGGAVIGAGCSIGSGAVVHGGSRLGERVLVEDGAVLGKRPRLRPGSSAAGRFGDLAVADDATICAGAVVYAGASIGHRAIVGDQSQVRERGVLGERSVLGRGSTIDFDAHVGARVSIQTMVYVTAGTVVEDDVFIGPGVVMTNDDTMSRHGPKTPLRGAKLKRACRVGGGVVLTPGVVIGEEAFIAAGAVVVHDVPERAVVMGVPGRIIRQVGDEDLLENWR